MKTKLPNLLACSLFIKVLFLNCCQTVPPNEPKTIDELVLNRNEVIDDMFADLHEGTPHGVPALWGKYPTFGKYTGGSPSSADWTNGYDNWTQVLSWGQVYASNHNDQCKPIPGKPGEKNCVHHELCSPDVNFPNIRVHLKDMELYIYRNDNTWEQLDYSDFYHATNPSHYGHLYVEDFADDKNKPADVKYEPEGGISIQAGSGWNFHFWGHMKNPDPNNRGIKGVFAVCKARLIGVEGNQDPKYLLSIGVDHWRSDGRFDWGGVSNIDIGCGRFKYVTEEWQYHTFCAFRTTLEPRPAAIKAEAQAAIIDNPSFAEVLLKQGIVCN